MTNVTLPISEENAGKVTNYIIYRVDVDPYQKSVGYFKNVDTTNNTGFYPPITTYGNYQSEFYMDGFVSSNSTATFAIVFVLIFSKFEVSNFYFEQIDANQDLIFESSFIVDLKMNNITVNNNDISNTDPTGFFFGSMNGGSIELSNITITNSIFRAKPVFDYRQSGTGTIKMQDVYVDTVSLGTDTKILKTQSLSEFEMINCSFSNVDPYILGDSSPKFVELGSIALADQSKYEIKDINVEKSTVGVLELSNIESSSALSASFLVSNLTYVDSYFEFSQDLVSLTSIEANNNFSIAFSDLNMQNITFVRTGNLMVLSHQASNTLQISNAYFSNVNGAQILIQSSNLQNTQLLSKVSMTNVTASSISGSSNSFIAINEGGRLQISDSSFTRIDNTERGAVLNAGYQNSQTEVHNSTFTENMSIYGGVANVQDGSVIKFYDCSFANNFAVQSGVIQSSNDGYYELYRSYITDNYAYTLSISEIFIVTQPPLFSNSTIYGNLVLSKDQILSEFDSCSLLCFLSDAFIQYVRDNLSLLDAGSIDNSIQCISGTLTITNNTYVTDQPTFINSYLSEMVISNLSVYNITTPSRVIDCVDSELELTDSNITHIYTSSSGDFLSLSFQSNASISNVVFSNSTVELFSVLLSTVSIKNLHMSDIIVNDYLLSFIDSNNVVMQDIMIQNIESTRDYIILVSESSIDNIQNITISDSNVTSMYILKSNVTMMNQIKISNVRQSIHIKQSHIDMFYNSHLSQSGSQQIINGGAMQIENSNMTMTNITFDSNTAQIGGAVSINCDIYDS